MSNKKQIGPQAPGQRTPGPQTPGPQTPGPQTPGQRTPGQRAPGQRAEHIVSNRFPWYSPRFWHGMQLGTWLRQLGRHRMAISPSRVPLAIGITGLSAINSTLATMDNLIFSRKVAQIKLAQSPLFILGHWRSGTTLLHELLIRDPEHNYATTYQCFSPHHFLLSESWFTPITSFLLPSRRPMDNMTAGWQRPQEDEFALGNLGIDTPYLSMMFPNDGPVCGEYLDLRNISPTDYQLWQDTLGHFLKRLSYHDQRRLIVKSPAHTARVRTLLKMFPTAQFVHLVRDPYALYTSTLRLWKSLHLAQGLQVPKDEQWLSEYVLTTHDQMYAAFNEDRELLGENQLVELRYEDLVANPKQELQNIYQQLELGEFSRAKTAVDAYLHEVKDYRPSQVILDTPTRQLVNQRWAGYFKQYGYDLAE
jgi:hypothetical protein